MLRVGLILLALLGLFYHGNAQGLTEEDLLLAPSDLLEQDLSGKGNSTYVQQVGDENAVEITQQQAGYSQINLVRVLQSGDYNEIYIHQNGGGNQTAVIQQGSENLYQLSVEGYDNNMAIIQEGDRNRVIQNLTNTNKVNIEFVQQGDDNEVIQNLNGTNSQEFKILQIGDGLRAIINQGPET